MSDELECCPHCGYHRFNNVVGATDQATGDHNYRCSNYDECGRGFDEPATRRRDQSRCLKGTAAELSRMDPDDLVTDGGVPDDPTDVLDDDDEPFAPDEEITAAEAKAMLELHDIIHFSKAAGAFFVGIAWGWTLTAYSILAWDAKLAMAVAALASSVLGGALTFLGPRAILAYVGGDADGE